MDTELQRELIEYLSDFLSEGRIDRINEVLNERTNHLTVVLEDLHKSHNANAVLRSCDCFGVQDVHIIENNNEFDPEATVSTGAHRWLTLHRYNEPGSDNVSSCFDQLRSEGYQIIATTPHEEDSNIHELDVTKKTALVFGTELEGVSNHVMELADGFVKIPMYGFSESFNISVSAAICMYELTKEIRNADLDWKLGEEYRTELELEWLKGSIKAGEQLVIKYLKENR